MPRKSFALKYTTFHPNRVKWKLLDGSETKSMILGQIFSLSNISNFRKFKNIFYYHILPYFLS